MRLLLRILLLIAIARLAYDAIFQYAFAFDEGYPLAPLLGMALCFWACVELRPPHSAPKAVVYTGQSLSCLLFLVLALASATFILQLRKEAAFTPAWTLHFATLTFFLLLIPTIVSYPFAGRQAVVGALASFTLLAMLWKGTELARLPRGAGEGMNPRIEQAGFPALPASNGPAHRVKPAHDRLPHSDRSA